MVFRVCLINLAAAGSLVSKSLALASDRMCHCASHKFVFSHTDSYGGGTRPWAPSSSYRTPCTDDGLIEVIGLTTYQLVSGTNLFPSSLFYSLPPRHTISPNEHQFSWKWSLKFFLLRNSPDAHIHTTKHSRLIEFFTSDENSVKTLTVNLSGSSKCTKARARSGLYTSIISGFEKFSCKVYFLPKSINLFNLCNLWLLTSQYIWYNRCSPAQFPWG